MPYAAGLLLAVTLAGCATGGAALDGGPTSSVASANPVAAPTTTAPTGTPTTVKPSSAAPDFPDGLPAAAKKHTKDGAKAFVEHFIEQIGRAHV